MYPSPPHMHHIHEIPQSLGAAKASPRKEASNGTVTVTVPVAPSRSSLLLSYLTCFLLPATSAPSSSTRRLEGMPKSRKEANRTRGARLNASNLGITASTPTRRSVRIRSTKGTQCSDTCSVSERETPPHTIVSAKAPGPERWREVLACIRDMRSRTLAPVDTMGCQLAHLGEELPEVPCALFRSQFCFTVAHG